MAIRSSNNPPYGSASLLVQEEEMDIEERKKYIIALSLIDGVGPVTAKRIMSFFKNIEECFRVSESTLQKVPGIGPETALSFVENREEALTMADKVIEDCNKKGVKIITIGSDDYPLLLRSCEDAPVVLYWKGDNFFIDDRALAVVGTRKPSSYGINMCKKIIDDIADSNVVVISGLADGIDTTAHAHSLHNGLRTFAVLGGGTDFIYPASNKKLAEQIMERGALISEFPPGTPPKKEYFPRRNRIIAGISKATIVVESREDGGAMITADYAISYGRKVFCVPARITDMSFSGCLDLIASGKAHLIRNGNDIFNILKWRKGTTQNQNNQIPIHSLSEDEQKILMLIKQHGEINIESLIILSGISPARILTALLNLQFKGLILEYPGKKYAPVV